MKKVYLHAIAVSSHTALPASIMDQDDLRIEVPGSLGTSASFVLRLGQTVFSSAALLFMCVDVDFYSYTSFWVGGKNLGKKLHKMNRSISVAFKPSITRIINKWSYSDCNCYLVTVMGLVIPWSLTLLVADTYSVFVKCFPPPPRILFIILLGDMVLSYLSLAAACSTASVADLLLDAGGPYCPAKLCSRYQLSAAMAFLSWFLSLASSLFNLWLLPSL